MSYACVPISHVTCVLSGYIPDYSEFAGVPRPLVNFYPPYRNPLEHLALRPHDPSASNSNSLVPAAGLIQNGGGHEVTPLSQLLPYNPPQVQLPPSYLMHPQHDTLSHPPPRPQQQLIAYTGDGAAPPSPWNGDGNMVSAWDVDGARDVAQLLYTCMDVCTHACTDVTSCHAMVWLCRNVRHQKERYVMTWMQRHVANMDVEVLARRVDRACLDIHERYDMHGMGCHVMSCHGILSWHVMLCHVLSCHVMSCHVMSCGVHGCHVWFPVGRIARSPSWHEP